MLAAIAKYFLQAYAGLNSGLQGKWQYLYSMTPRVAKALGPLETVIWEEFLPALIGLNQYVKITDDLHTLFGHSIKQGDLGL